MRYTFLAAVIFLALTACNKQKTGIEATSESTLTGAWELHRSFGGMMPAKIYAAGNGNQLQFDGHNYKMIRGGQTLLQGSYRLANDTFVDVNSCTLLPPSSTSPNWIVDNSTGGLKTCFEITNGLLKLTSGCIPADGGGSIYKKISRMN